jgi:hypothetical protein
MMGHIKIGNTIISTHDQNLTLQLNALEQAGCSRIFQENAARVRGRYSDRPNALDPKR